LLNLQLVTLGFLRAPDASRASSGASIGGQICHKLLSRFGTTTADDVVDVTCRTGWEGGSVAYRREDVDASLLSSMVTISKRLLKREDDDVEDAVECIELEVRKESCSSVASVSCRTGLDGAVKLPVESSPEKLK
jgi:hypothetical protein